MDIKQIRYFIHIVNYNGYTNAARSLFVTQPTLSQAIKKLESEFDITLFLQNNNGIVLTEAGKWLYSQGRELLRQFDQLTHEMHNFNQSAKQNIRIGLPTLFAIKFMHAFSRYMFNHPEVELTMVQGGSHELQEQLLKGEIDIGILSFPQNFPNLVIQPFQNEFTGYHAAVVVPKTHPLANRQSLSFWELKDEKFSTLSENFILGQLLHSRSRELGFHPDIVYTDDNWEVLLASLHNFNSVCLMAIEYRDYFTNSDLVWIPLDDKKNFFPIGIAYIEKKHYSQSISELITHLSHL